MNFFRNIIIAVLLVCSVMAVSVPVYAQSRATVGGAREKFYNFGQTLDLGTDAGRPQNVYEFVGRIVQGVIGISGVIALGFVVYGGVLFVTGSKGQGGTKEDVDKAKKIIGAAVIGLAILIASYLIAGFIINAIIQATTQVSS